MGKTLEKAFAGFVYFLSSLMTFVLNKHIVYNLGFESHYILIVIQSLLIVTFIKAQVLTLNISIKYTNIKKWYLASILLTFMLFTNMKAIFYIPMGVYTLYKNCTVVLTGILEFFYFSKRITFIAFVSFLLMIGSALIGNSDDHIKTEGYLWMLANIVATATYVIFLRSMMIVEMTSRLESVYFTNILSIPILFIFSVLFDKFNTVFVTYNLIVSILFSSVFAFLTSFSTSWALKILSSTSYSMIGALNKLFLSASGFAFFNEMFTFNKAFSVCIGIASALVYSFSSIKKEPTVILENN